MQIDSAEAFTGALLDFKNLDLSAEHSGLCNNTTILSVPAMALRFSVEHLFNTV